MLTRKQREQAQRRFVSRLDAIEVTAGVSLYSVLARSKKNTVTRVNKIIAEVKKADDPSTAIMTRLPEIRRVVAEEMGHERVVSGATAAIKSARNEALLVGTQEGTRRVSESTRKQALPVSQDRLSARQKQNEQDSEFAAAQWTQGTVDAVERGTITEALIVVATGMDVLHLATAVDKSAASRAAFGARNEVVGSARTGILDSFKENNQEGWVWVAEDDACEFCWGMSGLVFDITEELDSHPNCRCSQEPVEDINDPSVGFDPTTLFNELTADEQTAVLGRQGYEDFKAGNIGLRDVAAQRGGRITHAQVQRDVVRQAKPPEHLPGYSDLPGSARRLPPQVQDAITDQATASPRAIEWLDHRNSGKFGDPYFRELTTGMGVDNGPRVYSSATIDEYVAAGEIELFRGVSDQQFARDFVEGASNPGRGVYGSGYYATDFKPAAMSYAGISDESSTVVRMTIASDARVVDWDEMVASLSKSNAESETVAALAENRRAADIASLPFDPSPEFSALFRKTEDAAESLKAASARVADAEKALISEWKATVGDDLWMQLYDADKALADQSVLIAVAREGFTVPGVRIPRQLRDAAQEFVNADYSYKKGLAAVDNASTAIDFRNTVMTEGDALFGSTPSLLSGYDVVRVQKASNEAYYVILNRDVLRISDTAQVYVKSPGALPGYKERKLFANEDDALKEEIAALVDKRVSRAEELSKTLDEEMQQVADDLGATLDGLEFSVKGRDSMERKIRTKVIKSRQAGNPRTPKEILENDIRDANRYTMLVNTATYGDDVTRFVSELQARGYRFSNEQWRNTWSKLDDEGNLRAYRGLNVNMESPAGDLIEVQFHTKESFAVKQKNHGLYEEQRLPETSADRSAYLSGEMAANWDAMPDPVGWDKVLSVPGGSFAGGTVKPSKIVDRFEGARGAKKDAVDGIEEVLAELDKFMQLPPSLNDGGKISVWWGGQRFTKKELQDTVAFYQRTRIRATDKFVRSEMGISGSGISKSMTRREIVEDMASTFAHEFGHMVEGELFGNTRAITKAIDSVDDELYAWFSAVSESNMVKTWKEKGTHTLREAGLTERQAADYYDYYLSPEEMWARSFAQWFARKTGGKVYTEEALRNGGSFKTLVNLGIDPHWSSADFDKIEEAFDELFRKKGWMM